jgi:hypothetical protein
MLFEIVHSFAYLGSETNCKNKVRKRILSAGRTFHGLRKTLRSQLVSRKTKLLIYITLVRPVIKYASETWTLTKKEESSQCLFEIRILRCIFGAVLENGEWR